MLLAAVPLYRVYSLPEVDPGFSPDEYARGMTPEEEATFDLYARAAREWAGWQPHEFDYTYPRKTIALTAEEIDWVDQNRAAIATTLEASQGRLFNPAGKRLNARQPFEPAISQLAELMVRSAARLEDTGKLDEALDHYLAAVRVSAHLREWHALPIRQSEYHYYQDYVNADSIETAVCVRLSSWAGRPGQTPERILAAARQLEQLTSNISPTSGVKLACFRVQRFLSGRFGAVPDLDQEYMPPWTMLWFHLPWEGERALRLLNLTTRSQLDALSQAERAARNGSMMAGRSDLLRSLESPYYYWYEESEPAYALRTQIQIPPIAYDAGWGEINLVPHYTALETSRRAVRLLLALEAWKLEHSSLPETLDELVGPCLDRLPVDAYSGRPFRYFRDGLELPLRWNQPHEGQSWQPDCLSGTIAPKTPFIWAAGAKVCYELPASGQSPDASGEEHEENVLEQYRVYTHVGHRGEFLRPSSEHDVWEAGWPFAIP